LDCRHVCKTCAFCDARQAEKQKEVQHRRWVRVTLSFLIYLIYIKHNYY
jgi:hypothetical protein